MKLITLLQSAKDFLIQLDENTDTSNSVTQIVYSIGNMYGKITLRFIVLSDFTNKHNRVTDIQNTAWIGLVTK